MTEQNHKDAGSNMTSGIKSFIENEYWKSIIPKPIVATLTLIMDYYLGSKALIFVGGKLKALNLLNIVTWWKFVKSSKKFIEDMVAIWKE